MITEEKEFLEVTDEKFEDEYIVSDITKVDHYLLVLIGVVPFLIATIWYFVSF